MAVFVFSMGSVLIAILIGWILREATQAQKPGDHFARDSTGGSFSFWALVLLVSADALLSGPGKTVFLHRFPHTLVLLSFVIVGLLVAAFTLGAAWVARRLRHRLISGSPMSAFQLGGILTSAIVLEIVVFSFFMIWSGVQALHYLPGRWSIQVPLSLTLIMAVVLGGILSGLFYRRIRRTQTHNATVATTKTEGKVEDPTLSEDGRWGKTPSPSVPAPPTPQDASR
jgi:membrane protein implicated in regulation of membrane protease activity